METYTLAPEGFNRIKRRLIWLSLFFFAFILAALFYFSGQQASAPQSQESAPFVNPIVGYLIAVVFIVVILSVTTRNNIRKLKGRWHSYSLTLSPTTITKEEAALPIITIFTERITKLEETPGEGLLIKTAQRNEFIFIPVSLVGYDQVKSQLAQIHEVEPKSRHAVSWRLLQFMLITVLGAWLMYAVMLSQSVSFVLSGGGFLLLFFGWGLIESRHSLVLSKQQKRAMWTMIFPCISLLVKIISVLR